jgi:formyltetrahydrofolate-dependent phosphoribosylglycinamide formyltransferase
MRSIVAACASDEIPAEVRVVIAPSSSIPAAEYARNQNIPVKVITPGEGYEEQLLDTLEGRDLVCLAGYTRLLPMSVLEAHPQHVLNIHPALLPKFGGVGMFGLHVHRAVLASGDRESGCTVHFVTERYDEGETILQLRCPVYPSDTPEELAARVLDLEKLAYPAAIATVINGTSFQSP